MKTRSGGAFSDHISRPSQSILRTRSMVAYSHTQKPHKIVTAPVRQRDYFSHTLCDGFFSPYSQKLFFCDKNLTSFFLLRGRDWEAWPTCKEFAVDLGVTAAFQLRVCPLKECAKTLTRSFPKVVRLWLLFEANYM